MSAVSPQLEDVYAEIHRVLKPGALFASYEWVATAKFDAGNPDHVRVMDEINYGNGLPVRADALFQILTLTPTLIHADVSPLIHAPWQALIAPTLLY